MAPIDTGQRRQTLTVQELFTITDRAATTLANLAEVYTQRNDQIALDLFDQSNTLRAVARLAQEVIGASGQGCAADEVILQLGTLDAETTEYHVWYRHATGDARERVILVDATTPEEAKVFAERHFAGSVDIEVLRVVTDGQTSLMERVAGELRRRGIEASYEYPGFISFPGADSQGRQTSYAFGTANETWGGNRVAEDGDILGDTFDFPEFRSNDLTIAPSLIAARIATAVRS